MSAGAGIRHSEHNASETEPARFLQVWIEPAHKEAEPRYDQRRFDADGRHNRWQPLASGSGAAGALPIGQDAEMRVADMEAEASLGLQVQAGRHGYVQVVSGSVRVDGQTHEEGDALTLGSGAEITLEAVEASQVIWFDLS
jgi:quercetin 2,3-dioxygenase